MDTVTLKCQCGKEMVYTKYDYIPTKKSGEGNYTCNGCKKIQKALRDLRNVQ